MVNMNRRISVRVTAATQNDQGGNEAAIIDSWEKWAHIENRTGKNTDPYQQQVWQYDYKITMRYEVSRPTQSNYEIVYGNEVLKINSVSIENEGFKQLEVCRCSKVDTLVTINSVS